MFNISIEDSNPKPKGDAAMETFEKRLINALWGLFIGDALAMPAHWYYNPDNIKRDFNGGVRGYEAPPHPHPESFMVGMDYRPDVENANRVGRPYDILHSHARYYDTSYGRQEVQATEREDQHGNTTPRLEERYHYHHGLKAGENTLGAHLVRVLMRSVVEGGQYEPDRFLEGFVDHLTAPGRNRDPYTEIYIRRWFENYTKGLPPRNCAAFQRDNWSIGSHGGMIRPLVAATLADNPYQGLGIAVEHHNLTHRSENNVSGLGVLVPLLLGLLKGTDPRMTAVSMAASLRPPKVTGEELFALYRKHDGPGNIPEDEVWRLHTDLEDAPLDLEDLVTTLGETEAAERFATACYPEHGLPLLLYLARQHDFDVETSLLANVNVGGDNVHRGMLLGMVVGAAHDDLPGHLVEGLADYGELKKEIEGFAAVAVSGRGV
jgi:ADP-ribosylglycohydrolase